MGLKNVLFAFIQLVEFHQTPSTASILRGILNIKHSTSWCLWYIIQGPPQATEQNMHHLSLYHKNVMFCGSPLSVWLIQVHSNLKTPIEVMWPVLYTIRLKRQHFVSDSGVLFNKRMPREEADINKNAEYREGAHTVCTDVSFTRNKHNVELDRKSVFVSSGTVKWNRIMWTAGAEARLDVALQCQHTSINNLIKRPTVKTLFQPLFF